ncbi:MAG TPA: type-F conjugative transfer system secretin TraK [Planctomycetota bacterium]|nr:type-F conjugative transfer system secretin TraK [Planctomycetota bacterium]
MSLIALPLLAQLFFSLQGQDGVPGALPPLGAAAKPAPKGSSVVEWKEGTTIPVRVPVAAPGHEFVTTLAFPEDSIETAVSGWPEGELTAIQKRGLLFLRLTKRSEGQLNVIGGSGSHYLVYLKGVEAADPDAYDSYLKIERKDAVPKTDGLPKRPNRRPSGALELLQSMRLGRRSEGARILRAKRELAYESPTLEIRLLYVYETPSYQGYVYEVKNTSSGRLNVDASRLRGQGTALVLSALRENVLDSQGVTRLYAVTWKD